MARNPEIDARLRRWAEAVTGGDGSGYPVTSPLHQNWMPPSPGQLPTLKVARASDAQHTHQALRRLSDRLQATVVVHYVKRWSVAAQCDALQCAEATLHERIERVHAQLAREFCKLESSA